jgi:RNA polymerase sigma-70 factor (ECF subfamily)
MDIGDGDLVRLARDGDPAAFRLLVERHLPMARARAARLCPQPDDADDAVQDAFLQAFLALDRLRDPDRLAGWLGGIVANVCRAQRRRAPLTLLGDWPENLHPAAAGHLPSAEDLDRAVITGAPLAADDPVMDRLARPVTGPDLLSQFRSKQTFTRGLHRRFEPRNMTFTDGLDHWQLGGTFLRQGTGLDYSCAAEDGRAILAAAVPEPAGFAFLAQEIEPDDYRGRIVTFRGELRTDQADGRAGLVLRVTSQVRSTPPRAASADPREDPANHIASATGTSAWIQYEVTAQITADANLMTFGVFLNGGGQLELRHPELAPHPPGQQ